MFPTSTLIGYKLGLNKVDSDPALGIAAALFICFLSHLVVSQQNMLLLIQ